MKSVEILVAVRNETENIKKFVDKINKIHFDDIKFSIIFLEDGSHDDTLDVLRSLSRESKFVKYYSLKNDFGQYFALFFGINKSKADAIITMDVDGGHPVNIIKEMIKEFLNGYNVVQGHRVHYKQKEKYRSLASNLYNLFFLVFIGVNIVKQNSVFRLMDKIAYEKFKENFLSGYSLKTNFKKSDKITINYVSYNTPEREFGVSKYNFTRLAALSIKVAFSQLSNIRFFLLNLLFLSIGWLSIEHSYYFLSILSILIIIFNFVQYLSLRKLNPLSRIKILETNAD